MAPDAVEEIGVDIVARTGEFFRDINHAIDKGTRQLGDGFDNVSKKAGGLPGLIGGIGKGLGTIGLASIGISAVGNAFAGITKGLLGSNIQFEQFQTSFEVLLGSTDAAKARLAELSRFAAETPFELPDVVQADKLLQTFGGNVLATGDNLKLVGDMASAAGVGFSEVATWVGRAYTNIKSGRPFGEAAQRLQELGLLSGDARNRLEELQKTGATNDEVWSAFTQTMSQFGGMMGKQSRTMGGLLSTLSDNFNLLKREAFAGLFEALKEPLIKMVDLLGSPAVVGAAQRFGKLLGEGVVAAIGLLEHLAATAKFALGIIVSAFNDPDITSSGLTGSLEAVGVALNKMYGTLRNLWPFFQKVGKFMATRIWKDFAAVAKLIWLSFQGIFAVIRPLVRAFGLLGDGIKDNSETAERFAAVLTRILEAWLAFLAVERVVTLTQNIVRTGATLITTVKNIIATVTQTIQAIGQLIVAVANVAGEVVQYIRSVGALITQAAANVIGTVTQTVKRTGDKLLGKKDVDLKGTVQQEVKVTGPDVDKLQSDAKKAGLKWIGQFLGGILAGLGVEAAIFLADITSLETAIMVGLTAGVLLLAAALGSAIGILIVSLIPGIEIHVPRSFEELGQTLGGRLILGFIHNFKRLPTIIVSGLTGAFLGISDTFAKLEQLLLFNVGHLEVIVANAFAGLGKTGLGAFLNAANVAFKVFLAVMNINLQQAIPHLMETIGAEITGGLPTIRHALASILFEVGKIEVFNLGKQIASHLFDGLLAVLNINLQKVATDLNTRMRRLGSDIIGGLLSGIASAARAIYRFIVGLLDKTIVKAVRDFFQIGSPSRLMAQLGMDIMLGLLLGLTQAAPALLRFFRDLPPRMLLALGNLKSLLIESGIDLIAGLLSGVRRSLPALLGLFDEMPSMILKALGSLITVLYQPGRDLVHGLFNGAVALWEAEKHFWPNLPGAILVALGPLGNVLWSAGRELIQGLLNGIGSLVGTILGSLAELSGAILGAIGPLGGLLWGSGRELVQGLWNGIASLGQWLYSNVFNFAFGVAGQFIAGTGGIFQIGRNIVTGLWDGIASLGQWLYSKVYNFALGILDQVISGLGDLWPFSPSLAGIAVGEGLGLGIEAGILSALPAVRRAVQRIRDNIVDTLPSINDLFLSIVNGARGTIGLLKNVAGEIVGTLTEADALKILKGLLDPDRIASLGESIYARITREAAVVARAGGDKLGLVKLLNDLEALAGERILTEADFQDFTARLETILGAQASGAAVGLEEGAPAPETETSTLADVIGAVLEVRDAVSALWPPLAQSLASISSLLTPIRDAALAWLSRLIQPIPAPMPAAALPAAAPVSIATILPTADLTSSHLDRLLADILAVLIAIRDTVAAHLPTPAFDIALPAAPAFGETAIANMAQAAPTITPTVNPLAGSRWTNYGRVINVYGPGRGSRDVLRDLDSMVTI